MQWGVCAVWYPHDINAENIMDKAEERARQRRIKNFAVRVTDTRDPTFEGEKTVYVTYHGIQEFPISLAPHEARTLVEQIKREFGL